MASTHKHIRSSTANKRPTTAIADGQIALNTNASSPGLFFKDSTGASIIKIGPVHVGSTAPNVTPGAGGSSGNSTGEIWLDNSLTPVGVKIWNGSAWVNATPVGSTTVQGLLELATSAETQTGTDTDRAVTPAGLQSKLSDSTSTTSSITIASSTAVKSAYDLANAALPKSGGTITGNLEIGTTGSLSFEGSTADAFETTIAVTDPTADRTITLPDTTGTVVTTGDTGTVTGTMIASGTVTSSNIVDGTIVDADISASAEIAVSKLADGAARQLLQTDTAGTGVEWASNIDIPGTLDVTSAATFDSTIGASAGTASLPSITFTGDLNTGIYSPGADQVAISTSGTGRLRVSSTGTVEIVGAGTIGSTQAVSFNGSAPVNSIVLDSSGRLGIGTSSPQTLLEISANNGAAASNTLRFTDTDTTTQIGQQVGAIEFFSNDTVGGPGVIGKIECNSGGTSGDGNLYFKTGFASTLDTRLTINSAGQVGVGTTSPGAPLSVNGNAIIGPESGTRLAVNLTENDKVELQIVDSTSTARALALTVGTTEAVRITAASLVGIGTSNPDVLLTTKVASGPIARFRTADTNFFGIDIGTDGASQAFIESVKGGSGSYQPLAFWTGGSQRATIDTSGRLLVGTTSTSATQGILCQATAGADGAILLARNSAPSATQTLGYLAFSDNGHVTAARIAALRDSGTWTAGTSQPSALVFSTTADGASSPTERMRIDSAGKVGIGRAPINELDVYRASGTASVVVDSDSLANTESATFTAFGGARNTAIGVYKHSGITNPCPYILLQAEDAANNYYWTDNSDQFRISTTFAHVGTTSGTVVGTQTSDERLKNILGPVEYGLDTIKQIEPVRYALKTEPDTEKLGFIAQQVLPFIPQSVFDTGEVIEEGEPTKLGMEYVALIPVLVNAIKELSAEVDALKAQLQAQ